MNPFVPSKLPIPTALLSKILRYTIGFGVAIPRLLILVSAATLLALFLSLLGVRTVLSVVFLFAAALYRGDHSFVSKSKNFMLGVALAVLVWHLLLVVLAAYLCPSHTHWITSGIGTATDQN